MIPEAAVEAAAKKLFQSTMDEPWDAASPEQTEQCSTIAREILEAAAPHMLSHERQQTADAHRDAMVNAESLGKHEALVADLHYIADHKAADNQVGRWWAEVIRGAIAKNIR